MLVFDTYQHWEVSFQYCQIWQNVCYNKSFNDNHYLLIASMQCRTCQICRHQIFVRNFTHRTTVQLREQQQCQQKVVANNTLPRHWHIITSLDNACHVTFAISSMICHHLIHHLQHCFHLSAQHKALLLICCRVLGKDGGQRKVITKHWHYMLKVWLYLVVTNCSSASNSTIIWTCVIIINQRTLRVSTIRSMLHTKRAYVTWRPPNHQLGAHIQIL